MPKQEQRLLQQLKAILPNELYFIAPKDYFIRGLHYYEDERVLSYEWKDDYLQVQVRGSSIYSVLLFCEGTHLKFTCNCPAWTRESHCKHLICVLLTTKNLLSPNLFKMPNQDPARLERLSEALLNEKLPSHEKVRRAERDRYDIALDLTGHTPSLSIRKNKKKAYARWEIPHVLFPLFDSYSMRFPSEQFFLYLTQSGNSYPITLLLKTGEIDLSWDPERIYQSQTEMNVEGERVSISPRCLLNQAVQESAHFIGDFVADPIHKTLGIVNDSSGWHFYDDLLRLFLLSHTKQFSGSDLYLSNRTPNSWELSAQQERRSQHGSFQVSLKDFLSLQMNVAKNRLSVRSLKEGQTLSFDSIKDLILKVSGSALPIQISSHRYCLMIHPKKDEYGIMQKKSVRLSAACCLGESIVPTHAPTFQFFTYLHQARSVPSALRAKKRLAPLITLFLSMLSDIKTKTEMNEKIDNLLPTALFDSQQLFAYAKRMLKHFSSAYLESDFRLQFYKGQWHLISNQKTKEALLYQIPLQQFGAPIFYDSQRHYEMTIDSQLLHANLNVLYSTLAKQEIALFYNDKPMKTASWDVTINAKRDQKTQTNWFEILPEIRCNGEALDEAVWRSLLEQGGVVESGGLVQILDSNTQQILKSLTTLYKMMPKKKGGQKEIVQVPRLQILDWIALRNQGVKVILSDEDETLVKKLTRFTQIEPTALPKQLAAQLRPYQKEGYDQLAFLYQHRFGACLADDMGLGKTIQAISFLGGIHEGIICGNGHTEGVGPVGAEKPALPAPQSLLSLSAAQTGSSNIAISRRRLPHLVVLPPSLLFNWETELTRFYPNLKLYFYTGKERNATFNNCDVVITTYGLMRRDIEKLKFVQFDVIIFDEAQAIKNIMADTTCAARQLRGSFKLTMTGTPLENHLGEYYSLIDLCLPGLLGEYDLFKSQINLETSPMLETLIRRTRPFVLRRTKEAVLKDLPEKTETDVYLSLTERQKSLYQKTVAEIQSNIDQAYRQKTASQARIIALTAILKLRQLCISPRLLTHQEKEDSPKIDFLLEKLQELMEENHSALVFSQFTSFLDIVEERLKKQAIPFLRLDGKTPTVKRKELVQRFQGGEHPTVFLLSLKAGGQGLNLTRASYVFHLDPWWNPAVENQATDRAHRIGQTQKVSITRILMRHTIEEKMMVLKQKKLALYEAVMGDPAQAGKGTLISRSDFDFLLEGSHLL
ncbi:MAG: DEAD/DEAH box helicase [Nitrospirota bacterium]